MKKMLIEYLSCFPKKMKTLFKQVISFHFSDHFIQKTQKMVQNIQLRLNSRTTNQTIVVCFIFKKVEKRFTTKTFWLKIPINYRKQRLLFVQNPCSFHINFWTTLVCAISSPIKNNYNSIISYNNWGFTFKNCLR